MVMLGRALVDVLARGAHRQVGAFAALVGGAALGAHAQAQAGIAALWPVAGLTGLLALLLAFRPHLA